MQVYYQTDFAQFTTDRRYLFTPFGNDVLNSGMKITLWSNWRKLVENARKNNLKMYRWITWEKTPQCQASKQLGDQSTVCA